jgi:ribosomal protein S18 acetylase RimI-like enzyme
MLQPQYYIAQAENIGVKVFEEIASLVERGGAVQHEGLIMRIRSCYLVGFAIGNGHVVTSGAIKNPQAAYVSKVACNSCYKVPRDVRELGYVATDRNYRGRGFAREMCARLVAAYHKPLFATTSDAAMERILRGLGFILVGVPWTSDLRAGEQLALWLRAVG